MKVKGYFTRWRHAALMSSKSLSRLVNDPRFGSLSESLYKDAQSVVQALGKADGLKVDELFSKVPLALKLTATGTASVARGTQCERPAAFCYRILLSLLLSLSLSLPLSLPREPAG